MKLATNLLKFVVFIDVYVSIQMFLTFLVKNSYIFYCLKKLLNFWIDV